MRLHSALERALELVDRLAHLLLVLRAHGLHPQRVLDGGDALIDLGLGGGPSDRGSIRLGVIALDLAVHHA
eukprot:12434125-Alexandrium_andersonii.AAC.1